MPGPIRSAAPWSGIKVHGLCAAACSTSRSRRTRPRWISRFGQFQWVGEIERRYSIWDQPGKLAITGFLTRGRMGSFEDAIQLAALTGGPADIAAVRKYQSRGGISTNLEQQLMPNVGLFVRAGIADGDKESRRSMEPVHAGR
jgi:Carbohydrate-selective porin, OprB family